MESRSLNYYFGYLSVFCDIHTQFGNQRTYIHYILNVFAADTDVWMQALILRRAG